MTTITYYRYQIVPILDDDDTVEGWDVMAPGAHPDEEPLAEMLPDLDAAKAAVRDDRSWHKMQKNFGLI